VLEYSFVFWMDGYDNSARDKGMEALEYSILEE
jgi:hypothetical protein